MRSRVRSRAVGSGTSRSKAEKSASHDGSIGTPAYHFARGLDLSCTRHFIRNHALYFGVNPLRSLALPCLNARPTFAHFLQPRDFPARNCAPPTTERVPQSQAHSHLLA